MEQNYEALIITSTKVRETYDNEIEKYKNIVIANGGKIIEVDKWGEKRGMYNGVSGFYLDLTFSGNQLTMDKLGEALKADENVLDQLIVEKSN